jgi:hypothetical protein
MTALLKAVHLEDPLAPHVRVRGVQKQQSSTTTRALRGAHEGILSMMKGS